MTRNVKHSTSRRRAGQVKRLRLIALYSHEEAAVLLFGNLNSSVGLTEFQLGKWMSIHTQASSKVLQMRRYIASVEMADLPLAKQTI